MENPSGDFCLSVYDSQSLFSMVSDGDRATF